MGDECQDLGGRLAAQTQRLRLLLVHLAGRAILARVDVDDLAQEVFLRALSAPSGVPAPEAGEEPLYRYLATIARHAVVDVARAIRARKRDGAEVPLARSDWTRTGAGGARLAERGPGPSTVAAAREAEARMVAAFRDLSAEHRRVLGLRQFQGLSAADAARRMGRSEAAVHSLYRRALLAWSDATE